MTKLKDFKKQLELAGGDYKKWRKNMIRDLVEEHDPVGLVEDLFIWSKTPEGRSYWSAVAKNMERQARVLREQRSNSDV